MGFVICTDTCTSNKEIIITIQFAFLNEVNVQNYFFLKTKTKNEVIHIFKNTPSISMLFLSFSTSNYNIKVFHIRSSSHHMS